MKARSRILLLLAVLTVTACIAVWVTLPRLIADDRLRAEIKDRLESTLEAGINIGPLQWQWLPMPHLSIHALEISTTDMVLTVPRSDIYPDWFSLVNREPVLDRIVLEKPCFHLLKYIPSTETEITFTNLPDMVTVKEGTVRVEPGILLPGLLLGDRVTVFTSLSGSIRIQRRDNSARIIFSGTPPYAKGLHLEATTGPRLKSFDTWIRINGLDLNRLFRFYMKKRSNMPIARDVNLFIQASSSNYGHFKGRLKADTPCITLPDMKKDIDISCGVLDLDFLWNPTGLDVEIRKFDLEYPHLKLTGRINMEQPADPECEAMWKIDLQAADVDLGGVRRVVLNLFGKSEEAQQVCDIVRGGRAAALTYGFSGKSSDFEFIDHMLITAEVDKAPIYIPEPDLFLDEASGPIRIEGGVLYGKDLTGRLGRSSAENGRLVLGLSEDLFQFELDLDIRADLTELQPVLERLIQDGKVVDEIKKFKNVRGSAWGNLHIGDDLRDFDVWVKLSKADGTAFYERLGWPVTLSGGQADIGPYSVAWKDISGSAGKNTITRCSGKVDWSSETRLEITELAAGIDTETTLAYLNSFPALHRDISYAVSSLHGSIAVHDVKLEGPAFTPQKWKYSINAGPVTLAIKSPLLPHGGVKAVSGIASLTHRGIRIRKMSLETGRERQLLDAELSHHLLRDWTGRVSLSGTLGPVIQDWIVRNQWLDDDYRLSVPCHVPALNIDFTDSAVSLEGECFFDWPAHRDHSLSISISEDSGNLSINRLRVRALGKTAEFGLSLPASGSSIDLTWKGGLTGAMADRILEKNHLLQGSVEGDLSVSLRGEAASSPASSFTGNISVSALTWPWGLNQPLTINALSFQGSGPSGILKKLEVDLAGDQLAVNGRIEAADKGNYFDLSVSSPLFHRNSFTTVFGNRHDGSHETAGGGETSEMLSGDMPDSSEERVLPAPSDSLVKDEQGAADPAAVTGHDGRRAGSITIYGNISFEFQRYLDTVLIDTDPADDSSQQLAELTELKGTMELSPEGDILIKIASGKRCGLCLSGNETISGDGHEIKSFVFKSPENRENRFEKIEACIGENRSMIQGPMKVDSYFYLEGDTVKNGYLDIESHDGKIRQMSLLSSIFSVVNIVDFLGKQGWQEITNGGLAYSRAMFRSVINSNILKIEKAAVFGNGLNLFCTGTVDLTKKSMNLVVIVAPLKTVDAIVTRIPILGAGLGGEHSSFITIPVGVTGSFDNPVVKALPVKTVTDMLKKLIMSPIEAPLRLLGSRGADKEAERHPGIPVSQMPRSGQQARLPDKDKKKQSQGHTEGADLDPDE